MITTKYPTATVADMKNINNVILDLHSIGDAVSKETFDNIKEYCKTYKLEIVTSNQTEDSPIKDDKPTHVYDTTAAEQSASNNETTVNLSTTPENENNKESDNPTKQISKEVSETNELDALNPKNYFTANKDYIAIEYDPESRNYFVRRVFIVTFIMLAATSILISIFHFVEVLRLYFVANKLFFMIPSAFAVLVATYAMYCSPCTRKPPCSIIWLTITTVGYSTIGICVTVQYKTEILFLAFMATTVVVFVCTILAFSKFDFSSWLIYVITFSVAAMSLMLIIVVFTLLLKIDLKPLQIVILIISTIVQCVLLIIELQMILGGKAIELHKHEYSLAAFMLYTSIIEIFLKMVQLLGAVANYF